MKTDIIIIGAGLAGSTAGIVLSRAGYSVCLIDTRPEMAPEFRAEKMGAPQMALFERLGLREIARENVTPYGKISVARFGHIVSEHESDEYGFHYSDLVNGFRNAIPETVTQLTGRVESISLGDGLQSVALTDGRVAEGRLVVMATGLGRAASAMVGISRTIQSRAHSVSLGATMAAPVESFPFESLVYYGQGPRDRISYVSFFPTKAGMRANLFVYRDMSDPWVARFRAEPERMLIESMPPLARLCPSLGVAGPVAARQIDLSTAAGYEQDGIVLLGDAFMTCCPIVGMGIMKVLTDVEQLCCHHLPGWFASPGMSYAKIASFYADPVKRDCDSKGYETSVYARSIATDTGLIWAARRARNMTARQSRYFFQQASELLKTRIVAKLALGG